MASQGGEISNPLTGLGGLPARRPDQTYQPPVTPVSPGSAAGVVRARTVIITGGTASGIFVYSPSPGAGNLIGSWAGTSGVDQYGNAYPEGLSVDIGAITGTTISGSTISGGTISGTTVSGSVFDGTDFILNQSGLFVYSGTPTSGNLIGSIAGTNGTDGFGNGYTQGVAAYVTPGSDSYSITLGTAESGALAALVYQCTNNGFNVRPFIGVSGDNSSGASLTIGSGASAGGSLQSLVISDAGTVTVGNNGTLVVEDISSNGNTGFPIISNGSWNGTIGQMTTPSGYPLATDPNSGSTWATGERDYINNCINMVNLLVNKLQNEGYMM